MLTIRILVHCEGPESLRRSVRVHYALHLHALLIDNASLPLRHHTPCHALPRRVTATSRSHTRFHIVAARQPKPFTSIFGMKNNDRVEIIRLSCDGNSATGSSVAVSGSSENFPTRKFSDKFTVKTKPRFGCELQTEAYFRYFSK